MRDAQGLLDATALGGKATTFLQTTNYAELVRPLQGMSLTMPSFG